MDTLSKREVHLISLGAAIGCNCIPCTAYHLKECKANGVTEEELAEAIRISNVVKDVPSKNVTQTALRQLKNLPDSGATASNGCGDKNNSCGCQ
jgi:AhpD family alkylhydroperoxidase